MYTRWATATGRHIRTPEQGSCSYDVCANSLSGNEATDHGSGGGHSGGGHSGSGGGHSGSGTRIICADSNASDAAADSGRAAYSPPIGASEVGRDWSANFVDAAGATIHSPNPSSKDPDTSFPNGNGRSSSNPYFSCLAASGADFRDVQHHAERMSILQRTIPLHLWPLSAFLSAGEGT